MPNFKPVVRKDFTSQNGKARIYIQVPFKGQTRLLKTDLYIEPQFMQSSGKIKDSYPLSSNINIALTTEVMRCFKVFASGRFETMAELMNALNPKTKPEVDFFEYATARADDLNREKRYSTEGGYRSMIAMLKEMSQCEKLPFNKIDSLFLDKLKDYMILKGKSINTVIEYNKKINAIINHAVFKKVVDGSRLSKRNLSMRAHIPPIRLLGILDLQKILYAPMSVSLRRSSDFFFLSFYLGGMNPKDLLYSRDSHVYKDRLLLNRGKTSNPLSIYIPPEAWSIINKYKGKKYLLSFLDRNDSYSYYKTFLNATNKNLVRISRQVGINTKLCLKYARSSFATIASSKALKIPLEVIDFAQGRKIKGETSRYVEYDLDRIDDAQRKVIDHVLYGKA